MYIKSGEAYFQSLQLVGFGYAPSISSRRTPFSEDEEEAEEEEEEEEEWNKPKKTKSREKPKVGNINEKIKSKEEKVVEGYKQ